MSWELEPGGTNDVACECCGQRSRTVDGFLHEDGATRAAYLVQWTRGHGSEHGANFDLIIGRWGEDEGRDGRFVVSLVFEAMPGSAPLPFDRDLDDDRIERLRGALERIAKGVG